MHWRIMLEYMFALRRYHLEVTMITNVVVHINWVINVFVYAAKMPDFRRALGVAVGHVSPTKVSVA